MNFLKTSLLGTISLCLLLVSCDWKIVPLEGLSIQRRLDGGETPFEIYFNDNTLLDSLYGATYQGGLIFYLNTNNGSGMVAAPEDQGRFLWGCESQRIGLTSTGIGRGQSNTQNIINICKEPNIAALVCHELEFNNFFDWYLPSRDELNLMHQNLHLNGHGNFTLQRYWSSSEFNADLAHCQFFNLNTNQLFYDKDLIEYYVRAVRSF